METEYPKILDSREQSTMVSNWTEYLRLSSGVRPISLEHEAQYPNRSQPEPLTRVLRAGHLWPILKGARRVLLPDDSP
jgi:hypothetical protein